MDIDFNVIASMLYISISSACICGLNGNCIVGTVMLYVEKETTKWFIHIGVLTTRNQTEYIFFCKSQYSYYQSNRLDSYKIILIPIPYS